MLLTLLEEADGGIHPVDTQLVLDTYTAAQAAISVVLRRTARNISVLDGMRLPQRDYDAEMVTIDKEARLHVATATRSLYDLLRLMDMSMAQHGFIASGRNNDGQIVVN